MAIQNRRGSYADFGDGSNLVDGEFGMVQSGDTNTADGTGIYAAPVAGTVHRLLVDDDKTELAGDIAQNAQDISSINTTLTNINDVTEGGNSASINIPSGNTWNVVDTLSVPAGEYLVIGSVSFSANSTAGDRAAGISAISTPSGQFSRDIVSVPAATTGYNTTVQTLRYLKFSSTSTIYLVARQTSGTNLTVYPRLTIIRLR